MNILRRCILGIFGAILFTSAIGLAWGHVLSQSISPEQIKRWLNDGGFYEQLDDVIYEGIINAGDQNTGLVPADEQAFRERIGGVFDAAFLKQNTESAVDSIAAWLNGDVSKPDFSIDLTQKRLELASALGDYAVSRGRNLPVCSEITASIDPLSATCLPPGYDPAQLKPAVENELLNETSFIPDPIITADTFVGAGEQQSFFDQAAAIPSLYQQIYTLLILIGITALVMAAGIVLLSPTRRKGVLRVGIIMIGVTLALGIGYLFLSQGSEAIRQTLIKNTGDTAVNTAGTDLASRLFVSFAEVNQKLVGLYVIVYGLIAIACIVAYSALKPRTPEVQEQTPPEVDHAPIKSPTKEGTNEKSSAAKPTPDTTKSSKPPRRIQL